MPLVEAGPDRNVTEGNNLTFVGSAMKTCDPVVDYEWNFGDVNPPVHAWATWRVFQIDRKRRRIEHHGDHGDLAFLEDPGWDEVEDEFLIADLDGVPCVGPSLIADHHIALGGEDIDDLALAFISPLCTDY
jgi:hypothetical protein